MQICPIFCNLGLKNREFLRLKEGFVFEADILQ